MVEVVCNSKTYQVLVYAQSIVAARAYLRGKFAGCDLQNVVDLPEETKHFVLAETEKR